MNFLGNVKEIELYFYLIDFNFVFIYIICRDVGSFLEKKIEGAETCIDKTN